MPQSNTAIITAIIASLTTILVQVIWAQFVRDREKREKHHEWLRDKQVKDIEIIIPTLDTFLNEIFVVVESMNKKEQAALQDIYRIVKKKKEGASLNSLSSQGILQMAKADEKEMAAFLELDSKRDSWFGFEARRLTIWFQDEEVERKLSQIGLQFRNYHLEIYQAFASFQHFASMKSTGEDELDGYSFEILVSPVTTISQGDDAEAMRFYDSFSRANSGWYDLRGLVIGFQKDLVDKYKLNTFYQVTEHTDDGLLVYLAGHAEKGVRWLLHRR